MIEKIIATLLLIPSFIGGLLFPQVSPPQVSQDLGSVFSPAQLQKLTLSGSGVAASATSIVLQTMHTPDGRDVTMSMLGDIGYGTLEPTTSREESISFTGITQNADDTATLTGVVRGRDFVTPYAASTTLQKAHSGGAIFILTNTSAFYGQRFALTDTTSTITGAWTFASSTATWPRAAATTSFNGLAGTLFATKDYVDSVATSGAANADATTKGLVELATGAELASSTPTGGTGANLVAPSSQFSSTSSVAGIVPVIGSNGKLAQTFLNLNETFTFAASSTFSASTTMSGIPNGLLAASGSQAVYGIPAGTAGQIITSDGFTWTASTTLKMFLSWGYVNYDVPFSTKQVYLPFGVSNTIAGFATTTPAGVDIPVTRTGTIRQCFYNAPANTMNGTTHYFLVVNSVTSTLDIPVPAAAISASNTTGTAAVVAGDRITFSIHNGSSTSGTIQGAKISCELHF